ncbi:hypothetical protein OBBRIDRAFT_661328 [Obba rivulosa]|uniref:Uncharacterized protein n=1 Tax=Obba rivulosa TaxID=1052685 RepID=A0A8E2AWB1_9APHY|nr:hypothetical protein OBBRIDRAFT_661328 [Obba rivulosa]
MATNAGTMLIGIRALAMWRRNIMLLVMLLVLLLANLAIQVVDFALVNIVYKMSTYGCMITENIGLRLQVLVALGTDMPLLILTMLGLYSQCQPGGLWKIRFTQGLTWIALSTLAYVPLVVLMCLNLNGTMDIAYVPNLVIYHTGSLCHTNASWFGGAHRSHFKPRSKHDFFHPLCTERRQPVV